MKEPNIGYNAFCNLVEFQDEPVNHQVDFKLLGDLISEHYSHRTKIKEIFNELHDYIKIYHELYLGDIKEVNKYLYQNKCKRDTIYFSYLIF